jgi:hypothetical protein
MENKILDSIIENYSDEEILKADGFDRAIIGIETNTMRLVYDKSKMVEILIESEKMEHSDAIEYLEHNTYCAYIGERTPIYIETFL